MAILFWFLRLRQQEKTYQLSQMNPISSAPSTVKIECQLCLGSVAQDQWDSHRQSCAEQNASLKAMLGMYVCAKNVLTALLCNNPVASNNECAVNAPGIVSTLITDWEIPYSR